MTIDTIDDLVETPRGHVFARLWRPPEAADMQAFVLFHDSLGSVELWRDFPERLARATGRAVLAYDRVGFGRSDPHEGPIEADFMTAEADLTVPALRAHFGIGPILPLGHSVGGSMAVATAARAPHLCPALITIAAQAFVEDRTIVGIEAARESFLDPAQVERLGRYHGDKARWVLDAWIETWLSPDFADWTLDAELGRLACPILALHGERDEFGSEAHPRRIAGTAAGPGEAVILAGCGHVPHREQPDIVIGRIEAFLAERGI